MIPKLTITNKNLIKETILKNGLKIVTFENNKLLSNIMISFKNCGLRYENPKDVGYSNLFKYTFDGIDTKNKFYFQSEIEMENISHICSFNRKNLKDAVPLFFDSIYSPDLNLYKRGLENLKIYVDEKHLNPANVFIAPFEGCLQDNIRNSSFIGGLSNPQVCYPTDFSSEKLENEYIENKFKNSDNIVITAVGVDHDEFSKLIEENIENYGIESFEDTNEEIFGKEQTIWKGGETRIEYLDDPYDSIYQGLESLTSLIVSIPTPSNKSEDTFIWYLIEYILGGGDRFGIGGPGRGISSVIFQQFLPKYYVWNMEANFTHFSDIGIFNIHSSTNSNLGNNAGEILFESVLKCYSTFIEGFNNEQLESAKNRFLISFFGKNEGNNLNTFLNYEYFYFDEYRIVPEYIKEKINSITLDDINRVFFDTIHSNSPAVTIVGNEKVVSEKENFDYFFTKLSTMNDMKKENEHGI